MPRSRRRIRLPGLIPEPEQVRFDAGDPRPQDAVVLEDVLDTVGPANLDGPGPATMDGAPRPTPDPSSADSDVGEVGTLRNRWPAIVVVGLLSLMFIGWTLGGMQATGANWTAYLGYFVILFALLAAAVWALRGGSRDA